MRTICHMDISNTIIRGSYSLEFLFVYKNKVIHLQRTCGRVKSDVTVEVARDGSPAKTYHSEPANTKVKQSASASRGGTQNNNADDVDGESTCDDEARPANQIQWENADLVRGLNQPNNHKNFLTMYSLQ